MAVQRNDINVHRAYFIEICTSPEIRGSNIAGASGYCDRDRNFGSHVACLVSARWTYGTRARLLVCALADLLPETSNQHSRWRAHHHPLHLGAVIREMKHMLVKFVGCALIVGISGGVSSASGFNSLQELVGKSFTSEYAGFLVTATNGVRVEVCGDSCSYFEWSGDRNDERYWRFITLFELSDAPGTDVGAFLDNVKTLKVDDLVEKKFCAGKSGDVSR